MNPGDSFTPSDENAAKFRLHFGGTAKGKDRDSVWWSVCPRELTWSGHFGTYPGVYLLIEEGRTVKRPAIAQKGVQGLPKSPPDAAPL